MFRDVALLHLQPVFQGHRAVFGMLQRVRPDCVGQRLDERVGSQMEPFDKVERRFYALVVIAQRDGPLVFVVGHQCLPRLGDVRAASDVAMGLAVAQVDQDLVNAPPIRRRLKAPHRSRELL